MHERRFDQCFAADAAAVRAALIHARRASVLRDLPADAADCCELVLAEAMNNIVEHAYAESGGPVRLTLMRARRRVICRLLDRGQPLPGLTLPRGALPVSDSPREGGYGWFLIHSLSQRLIYRRSAGTNRLFIVVPANNRAA
jgi:serine/threonine-protein kinase RsbW